MYVDPFLAGVVVTLMTEIIGLIIFVWVKAGKNNDNNKMD